MLAWFHALQVQEVVQTQNILVVVEEAWLTACAIEKRKER